MSLPDLIDADGLQAVTTFALFDGDDGGLTLAQRTALVRLLQHRYISSRTHPVEWKTLVANPRPIRSRINDLFMELVISSEHEVAYKRQVTPESGGRFPTLLQDRAWGREDTLVLIFLRTRYRSERATGAGRAFIDRADIHEYVQQHRPASATDRAGDRGKLEKAIERIHSAGLLLGKSDADRWEISNAIEELLPLPKLQELLEWLRQQTSETGETGASAATDDAVELRLREGSGADGTSDFGGLDGAGLNDADEDDEGEGETR